MDQRFALGRAIAEQRRRHGLSQAELARRLDRPASWVSLVERGLVHAEPMPVLEAVASALGTPLPARHAAGSRPACPANGNGAGGGGAATNGGGAKLPPANEADATEASVTEASARLACVNRAGMTGSDARLACVNQAGMTPIAALRAGADRSWTLTRAGRYGELADLLSTLLPELNAALRAVPGPPERAVLHELIATCYQACSAALARLGDHEGAKAAASRALSVAQRAGDLPLAAAGAYLLARILMEAGRYPQAEETARKATAALAPLAADGRPEAVSLQGGLTLLRALIAARTGDPVAAGEHLSRARDAATRLTATRSGRDTGFGPAQVALYEIAVSVEAGERHGESASVRQLPYAGLPGTR